MRDVGHQLLQCLHFQSQAEGKVVFSTAVGLPVMHPPDLLFVNGNVSPAIAMREWHLQF